MSSCSYRMIKVLLDWIKQICLIYVPNRAVIIQHKKKALGES